VAFGGTSLGGTIQSTSSGTPTFSGVFSGSGGLTFVGGGTVIVTGANTYTGVSTVASGEKLSVNGVMAAYYVTVNAGGILGGSGVLSSTTIQSKGFKPGN
jgi:autotransporter-associated beta strand protein